MSGYNQQREGSAANPPAYEVSTSYMYEEYYYGRTFVVVEYHDPPAAQVFAPGLTTQYTRYNAQQQQQVGLTQRPEYLIIGLFSLRLAKRLIQSLAPYEGRDRDLEWIHNFLQPYHREYALAELRDPVVMDDYVSEYPRIVQRFIRQPGYPQSFEHMNPDRQIAHRELTDAEAEEIVNFVDAAGEWGSTVPLPERYRNKVESMAARRLTAR